MKGGSSDNNQSEIPMELAMNPKSMVKSGNATAEQMFPINEANKLREIVGIGNGDFWEDRKRQIK